MHNDYRRCRSGKKRRLAFLRSLHTWAEHRDRKLAYFKDKQPEGEEKQTACRAGDRLSPVNICQGRMPLLNSSSPLRENPSHVTWFQSQENITLKAHWKRRREALAGLWKKLQPTVKWYLGQAVTIMTITADEAMCKSLENWNGLVYLDVMDGFFCCIDFNSSAS